MLEKECSEEAHSRNGPANGVAHSKVPAKPRREKLFSFTARLLKDNGGEAFTSLDELQITTKQDTERAVELLKKLRYRIGVLAR